MNPGIARATKRTFAMILAAAFLVGSGFACATTPEETEEGLMEERDLQIRVENTLSPPNQVRVAVASELGTTETLGTVLGGNTETFTFDPETEDDRIHLVASAGGQEITSDPFVPSEISGVTWDLSTNTLTRNN